MQCHNSLVPSAARLLVVALVACGARPQTVKPAAVGDDITLYRDLAVIRQRVVIDVSAKQTSAKVLVAAGVAGDHVMVLDRGGLTVHAVHGPTNPQTTIDEIEEPAFDEGADDPMGQLEPPEPEPEPEPAVDKEPLAKDAKPTEIVLDVSAPRPGKYAIVIGYVTNRVEWDVAYTMSATPQRDRAVLRGALAIKNRTGIPIRAATARIFDAELGAWRGKTAEQLATALVGGTPASTQPATPRELGALAIGQGETRVELVRLPPHKMSSVLVYDPIGTKLDNPGAAPLRDIRLGIDPPAGSRVTESFEVTRDESTVGLPSGPVRLLEQRADGSIIVLGESRLFEQAARAAKLDTIAVGTAEGVTGARERRELTTDDDNRRLVEEFVITIDNQRPHKARVLLREHLYRGQNWTLAYHSAQSAAKEGPQQIALRVDVPARSKLKVLYVVVYTWGP